MAWFSKPRSQPASKPDDWRLRADPDDLREYDAFGPWVFEIRSESEMPKRFHAHYAEHSNARYLIKVPINLERRVARPGMDLYHTVIAIDQRGMTVMRLQSDAQIESAAVTWSDVVAIRCYTNLLIGRWSLLLGNGGEVTIDYNAVSARLIEGITEFIRAHCFWSTPTPDNRLQLPAANVIDPLFQYHQMMARRVGPQPAVVVHYEAKNLPCRDDRKKRRWTTGLMLVDGPNELTIVADNPPERRPFQSHFAVCVTYIPYARISSFAVASPVAMKPPQFQTLILNLDQQAIRQRCLKIPESLLMFLSARGIAQVTTSLPSAA